MTPRDTPLPPADSDFYRLFSTLAPDDEAFRLRCHELAERQVRTLDLAGLWERAEFPGGLIGAMREAGIVDGIHPPEDDAAGRLRPLRDGLSAMELARVDPSCATFMGVHSGLVMGAVKLCGSDEQRREWLPRMRRWETVGAFALTEPEIGSAAAGGLTTTCERDGDGWVLSGRKRWIGNATFADLCVVWARDVADHQVKGFLVDTRVAGFSATKMEGKIAQRIVQNADVVLERVRVPESRRLARAQSFADTARVLAATRLGVAWIAVGCARGAYETALRYAQTRVQFGKRIAEFQLVQRNLVEMLGTLTAMQTLALRATQMQESGTMHDEHASLAKQHCAAGCRRVVALARETLGGNGILLDHDAARFFADAEAIYSYEGTNEINTLIVGRAVTGFGAFV